MTRLRNGRLWPISTLRIATELYSAADQPKRQRPDSTQIGQSKHRWVNVRFGKLTGRIIVNKLSIFRRLRR